MKSEEILDLFRYYTGESNHARYNEINQAYRNVLKRTKYWNTRIRKEDLISLSPDTDKYKVDFSCFRGGSPTHVYAKSISTGNWYLLKESKFESFEEGKINSDERSDPASYYLTGDIDYNFYISPTPYQELSIRVDGIAAIEDLDRGVTPIIHKDYHEAIAILASSIYLKQKRGVTQEDIARSTALSQEAEKELLSLIEDMHPNRNGSLSWRGAPLLY